MPRPAKDLTEADRSLILTAREAGLGFRLIARAVSDERGAFDAVGRTFRDRYVGKDLVAAFLNRLETEPSGNDNMNPKTDARLETDSEVEQRLTEQQSPSLGGEK